MTEHRLEVIFVWWVCCSLFG